jgi:glucokinase
VASLYDGDVTDGPILGIDIGGTKLAAGVSTEGGELLSQAQLPTLADEGPDAVIERILELSRTVVADAGCRMDDLERIGIGCGGPLDPWRGVITNALNLPGWIDIPIVDRIQRALGRPASVDNDANAAALAEHRFGAGRGVRNLVYLTVSTGVGGGVIADDRLLRGENGNAAELGHVSVDVDGRACHCGSIGCLETYASGTNIAAIAREWLAGSDEASALRDLAEPVRAEDVAAAARAGDAVASEVWGRAMLLLGAGIVSIIHAFNPALVVLGGGVTRAGDDLFAPVRDVVAKRTMPWLRDVVEVVPAALGTSTGILGAVAVALDARDGAARNERGGDDVRG